MSRALWIFSFLFGLAVAGFVVLTRDTRIAQVVELVTELQPDRAPETIDSVAALVFWCTLGALAAMIIIEALLVRSMMRRHGRVRFALAVVLALHIGVSVLADAFAILSTDEGAWLGLALVVQLVLAVVAVVASFLPGSASWFRAGRQISRR